MGKEEAAKALSDHMIPNTDRLGNPKDVYFTRDEPMNGAKAAQERYTLPKTPTHRATVPEENVPNTRVPENGPTADGGGSQVITNEEVPVSPNEIVPLDPEIPVDPIIIDPIP